MPKKIIVIHGSGSRIFEAVSALIDLENISPVWKNGVYFVERRQGLLIQRLLQEKDPSELYQSYQKFIIGRLLLSSFEKRGLIPHGALSFFESRLIEDFNYLAIPLTPDQRFTRAKQLVEDGEKVIRIAKEKLKAILNEIRKESGGLESESSSRDIVVRSTAELFRSSDMLRLIESVRETYESGGDTDSLVSAALYTYWIKRENPAARYGIDYDYAFLNYHERLIKFTGNTDSSLLIADIPLEAISNFTADVMQLKEHDCTIERFEDHHPISENLRNEFDALREKGLISFADIIYSEDTASQLSAADIIYKNLFLNRIETDGAKELIKAVRAAEFSSISSPIAAVLINIAASDISKIEIIEELVNGIETNSFEDIFHMKGWDAHSGDEFISSHKKNLLENVYLLQIKKDDMKRIKRISPAYATDAVIPDMQSGKNSFINMVIALAPQNSWGKPKIYVGKSAEFYAKQFPFADYLLYCYGSNTIYARRFSNSEYTVNLDLLIKSISTNEDGLLDSTAAGRPWLNANYPTGILGRVNRFKFHKFIRYISKQLDGSPYKVHRIKSLSSMKMEFLSLKRIRVFTAVLLIMLAAAAVYIHFISPLNTEEIIQSNFDLTGAVQINIKENAR